MILYTGGKIKDEDGIEELQQIREPEKKSAMEQFRECVGMEEGENVHVRVQAAPRNGCCWWYCFGRCVKKTKDELVDMYAEHLERTPAVWEVVRVVEDWSTPEAYVEALRSGGAWADEAVMAYLTKAFEVQLLLVGVDEEGVLKCTMFPHRRVYSRYATVRFVTSTTTTWL